MAKYFEVSIADKVQHTYIIPCPFRSARRETTVDYSLIEIYKEWCKEYVGANNWNFYGFFQGTPLVFRFRHEADLLAFRLTFII
jgi:hypothetical protein